MYSHVLFVCLVPRWARGTGGAEVIVTNVDIRCGHMAGMVHYLVETVDCLSSGGNPDAVGEQNSLLCLREGRQAIVDLAGYMRRASQVNDSGAGGDDDGVIRKRGGEGKGGGRSLIGVCIGVVLLPCVLLDLASGGALATVGLLLLLLASLLLLLLPVPLLLLLPLVLLL